LNINDAAVKNVGLIIELDLTAVAFICHHGVTPALMLEDLITVRQCKGSVLSWAIR